MKLRLNMVFLVLLGALSCCSPQKDPVNLIFTGDVILARGVSDKLRIYGDTLLSQRLKPLLQGGFVAINLETVLTTDTIPKTKDIMLRADPSLAKALKAGGVNNVFMSNNHALDFGADGLESTRYHLEKAGLPLDKDVSKIIEGEDIYVMARSLLDIENFEGNPKINTLIDEVYDKSHGKYKRPVILYLHWGVEYQSEPTEEQRELAHRLIDAGADAIIGHHPHVFQSIEFYRHKPIIYSLGNFVADAYLPGTTQGAIASISLSDTLGHVVIKPVDLSDYFPREMSTKEEMTFFQENLTLNDSICFLKVGNQWQVREVRAISFNERATHWFFSAGRGKMLGLRKLNEHGYKLSTFDRGEFQNSIALYGQLSQLKMADIDNDGQMELMLNISKRVDFDDRSKNRLNIFDIEADGIIKAQWLGTKFLYDLESFDVVKIKDKNYLKTVEKEARSSYENLYEWDEFGFALSDLNNNRED